MQCDPLPEGPVAVPSQPQWTVSLRCKPKETLRKFFFSGIFVTVTRQVTNVIIKESIISFIF